MRTATKHTDTQPFPQHLAAKARKSLRSDKKKKQRPERTITRDFNSWKLPRVEDRLISLQSLLSHTLPLPPWQSPPQPFPTQDLTRAPCSDKHPAPDRAVLLPQHPAPALRRPRTPPTAERLRSLQTQANPSCDSSPKLLEPLCPQPHLHDATPQQHWAPLTPALPPSATELPTAPDSPGPPPALPSPFTLPAQSQPSRLGHSGPRAAAVPAQRQSPQHSGRPRRRRSGLRAAVPARPGPHLTQGGHDAPRPPFGSRAARAPQQRPRPARGGRCRARLRRCHGGRGAWGERLLRAGERTRAVGSGFSEHSRPCQGAQDVGESAFRRCYSSYSGRLGVAPWAARSVPNHPTLFASLLLWGWRAPEPGGGHPRVTARGAPQARAL